MWESPIDIICKDVTQSFEDSILTAVHSYDIKVNKNELIKALDYDRGQYEKGFEDGKKSVERIGYWFNKGSLSCRCSECGCKSPKEYKYCPNCGAKMDEV